MLSPRLLAAAGMVVAGLVGVLLLQDHLVGDFTASVNVVPRSYRIWRDPIAVICAFVAFAVAVRIAVRRLQRLQLALAVMGCALAAAIYTHQKGFHVVCPPGDHCEPVLWRADLLHDSRSLLILAVGLVAAMVLLFPLRWMTGSLMRPRRG